jgi:hypothetical protein
LYSYLAFGLGICSEICLPELWEEKKRTSVKIKRGKLDEYLRSQTGRRNGIDSNESEVFCSYKNIATFLINEGREIIVDPALNVEEKHLRHYLLGNVLSIALHQRGFLVLHGSAVAQDGRAIAFLGPSGYGKSTAAALLSKKGYSIMADDVVAVKEFEGVSVIYPAFPQLKLLPEIAEALGFDMNSLLNVSSTESKLAARLDSCYSLDPVPLKQIYIMEKGETIKIERLTQRDSMMELVRNSYSSRSLIPGINQSAHFAKCAKIAKDIPISRLARPIDLKALASFAEILEHDVRSICYH